MKKRSKAAKTAPKLAKTYHCNVRTISTWRKEGAPLADPAAMRAWLANRKNIPPNLAGDITSDEGRGDDGPQALGAAATLTRLEKAELAGYKRLQRAIRANDPLGIKTARDSWLKIGESLRHYERAVSEDKKKAGELVSRSEVVRALQFLGMTLRQLSEGSLPELVNATQGEPDIIRARQIIRRAGWFNFTTAIASGIAEKIPGWITEAFAHDLRSHLSGDIYADAIRLAPALASIGAENARLAVENKPAGQPQGA